MPAETSAIKAAAIRIRVAADGRLDPLCVAAPMGLRLLPQFDQRQVRRIGAPLTGARVTASYRIAIVGSGPAGLSAAARAAALGIPHVLLEKADHLSDTIYKYQKGKHVMATPSQLVLRSDMPFDAGKREAVLAGWDERAGGAKSNVLVGGRGQAVSGEKGALTTALAG